MGAGRRTSGREFARLHRQVSLAVAEAVEGLDLRRWMMLGRGLVGAEAGLPACQHQRTEAGHETSAVTGQKRAAESLVAVVRMGLGWQKRHD